ncbi:MAG: hypothetical protein LAO77_07540 [Acidobacteriia bacterium]|nr:hypothetical protein [Terriglobia bacterium]
MRRPTALSTFVVTVVVLAVIVAVSLRKAGAQADKPSGDSPIVYLPVAALTHNESASVHVVNVSKDHSAPALRFMIMFADARGVLLGPEKVCEARASETCTVVLSSADCPAGFTRPDSDRGRDKDARPQPQRCEFRAVVVGETLACSSPFADGAAEWTTNLELVDPSGGSKFVAGPNRVLKLPRDSSCSGNDTSVPPPDLSQPLVDLAGPPPLVDLAGTPPPVDLAGTPPPADLAQPPADLSQPPADLSQPPADLSQPPADLTVIPDLSLPPPDLTAPAGFSPTALSRPLRGRE